MIKFFNKEEEERIIQSIRNAESNTSGEIRVHIEDNAEGDILDLAANTFQRLDMHKTKARNGVLIFLAPERKEFAIIGDQGINDVVSENFWDTERDLMQGQFRMGQFCEGVCLVIQQVGIKLKKFFPHQADDENELPDEISYN